jgi:NAD(P)-dependent dehydrogenase (short-subunit alcohol dehydrogenase family)
MHAVVFGAGGGIGGALVAALAKAHPGATIHAGTRRRRDIPGPPDCDIRPFAFDLTDEASIAAAFADIAAASPAPLDQVMVATGILQDETLGIRPERSLQALDAAAMARVLAINTIGPALIAKHALPRLPRDRRAVLAAISARVGSIGDNRLGGWHSYRASKAALNMLIANVGIELARSHPQAIAVALHPGTVATPLSAPFQRNVPSAQLLTAQASAKALLRVIDRLTPADSGGFRAWDGASIPW